jgi:hypothetical protein
MGDIDIAIAAIQRQGPGALSVDQCMAYHTSGALPLLPPPGVRITFVSTVLPYSGGDSARFHKTLADELVRRGVAAYA